MMYTKKKIRAATDSFHSLLAIFFPPRIDSLFGTSSRTSSHYSFCPTNSPKDIHFITLKNIYSHLRWTEFWHFCVKRKLLKQLINFQNSCTLTFCQSSLKREMAISKQKHVTETPYPSAAAPQEVLNGPCCWFWQHLHYIKKKNDTYDTTAIHSTQLMWHLYVLF